MNKYADALKSLIEDRDKLNAAIETLEALEPRGERELLFNIIPSSEGPLITGPIQTNEGGVTGPDDSSPVRVKIAEDALVYAHEPSEKQALLEAADAGARSRLVTSLIEMAVLHRPGGQERVQ